MSLLELLSSARLGSIVSILVIALGLIEVTPIPIHPLEWIGKRVNKDIIERVDKIDSKLNEHMVGSYRTQILDFSDCVMSGQVYTHDKWRAMLRVCYEYEEMIEKEHLINGDATEAIEYIKTKYQEVCNAGNFVTLPIIRRNEKAKN